MKEPGKSKGHETTKNNPRTKNKEAAYNQDDFGIYDLGWTKKSSFNSEIVRINFFKTCLFQVWIVQIASANDLSIYNIRVEISGSFSDMST